MFAAIEAFADMFDTGREAREHERLERANDQFIRRQMDLIKEQERRDFIKRIEALESQAESLKRQAK